MVNPRARNKTARLAHSGYLVRLPEQGRVPLKRIQTANGLALRDWRYVVRIANIDVSNLSEPSSAANIAKLMVKALHRIPNRGMGRPVFYMNRTVGQALDLQSLEKTSLAISVKETEGEWWTSFRGVPIRETDALLETEARVV